YFNRMRIDPRNPKWPDRDRFILSKGHACPVLYCAMAEAGYTPIDQLNTFRKLGSIYQGHPDMRFIPNLEASTGSLGECLSLAIGWHTLEIDGHSFPAIQQAFQEAEATKGKPTCIVAHTVKGKGVSFMENNPKFHGTAPTADEVKLALQELQ